MVSMTRRAVVALVAAAMMLTACAGDADGSGASETPSPAPTSDSSAAPEDSAAPAVTASGDPNAPIPVTADNLEEAFIASGLDCDLVRSSTVCYFDDVPMPIVVPFDWDVDVEERAEACEQGYIAPDYEVVGDGATWYAAPNQPEYADEMIDALAVAGYEASLQPYCPA